MDGMTPKLILLPALLIKRSVSSDSLKYGLNWKMQPPAFLSQEFNPLESWDCLGVCQFRRYKVKYSLIEIATYNHTLRWLEGYTVDNIKSVLDESLAEEMGAFTYPMLDFGVDTQPVNLSTIAVGVMTLIKAEVFDCEQAELKAKAYDQFLYSILPTMC